MKVVFRADASASIGGGHAMRCLTLAAALAERGWHCLFASRGGTTDVVPMLSSAGYEILELAGSAEGEAGEISDRVGRCELLVADHYQRDAVFETGCRQFVRRILVIDDLANRKHDCDVLLDQTLGRAAEEYDGLVPGGAQLLVGSSYSLIRPAFGQLRTKALTRRDTFGGVRRILVSLGAADPLGMNRKVLQAISLTQLDLAIDVVVGNANVADLGLTEIANNMPQVVEFHGFDADMAALMCDADLAIGAAGTTSWERCCLGLPTLMIVTAENQRNIASELEAAGAAVVFGQAQDADVNALSAIIESLAMDGPQIRQLAKSAASICDGEGALRVASVVAEL